MNTEEVFDKYSAKCYCTAMMMDLEGFKEAMEQYKSILQAEVEQLRQWKEEAMEIMSDFQEIGKEIGLPLGNSIGKSILPYIKKLKAELSAPANEGLHPDTYNLVKEFSQALADKLLANQRKYGYQNEWLVNDWEEECRSSMMQHIEKGDPRDVAIYAAFMWARGWSTKQP